MRFSFTCAQTQRNTTEANNNLSLELSPEITLLTKNINDFVNKYPEVLDVINPFTKRKKPESTSIQEFIEIISKNKKKGGHIDKTSKLLLQYYDNIFVNDNEYSENDETDENNEETDEINDESDENNEYEIIESENDENENDEIIEENIDEINKKTDKTNKKTDKTTNKTNETNKKENSESEELITLEFQNMLLVPYILDKLASMYETVIVYVPLSYAIHKNICFNIKLNKKINFDKNYLQSTLTIWKPVNLTKYINFVYTFLSFIHCILHEGYNFMYPEEPIREFPVFNTKIDNSVLLKYMKQINDS
jgi:hypothetical protein